MNLWLSEQTNYVILMSMYSRGILKYREVAQVETFSELESELDRLIDEGWTIDYILTEAK